MKIRQNTPRGQGLIAAIAIILILSVFGLFIVSMLSTQTAQTVTEKVQSAQALSIAKAGVQWYLEQLARSTNWVGQSDVTGISFADGTFDVNVDETKRFSTSIQFTVTGRMVGFDGRSRERYIKVTAKKLPAAYRFALYWGTRPTDNSALDIRQSSQIIGDFWSRGSSQISSNSSLTQGVAYYAQGQDVSGSGFTKKSISLPPEMPVFTTTYYDAIMSGFDTKISQVALLGTGFTDVTLTADLVVPANSVFDQYRDIYTNGRNIIINNNARLHCRNIYMDGASQLRGSNFTINCNQDFNLRDSSQIRADNFTINCNRDFNTLGNNAIVGSGSIVTLNDIQLHSQITGGGSWALTVTPPVNNRIDFISRRSVYVNRANANNISVTMNPSTRFYSQCQPATIQHSISVVNTRTRIDNTLLIGRRQVNITNGAQLTNATLFVTDFNTSSNYIYINGTGTSVSGNVISLARVNPGLQINNASVTGLIYHRGGATGGSQLQGAILLGSMVASGFTNNRISGATITYSPLSLDAFPPEGFEGYVMVTENSWDAL